MKNKGGRPTKYKAEYAELAYNYCLLGAKDTQLADFLKVDQATINRWKKAHPKFCESLKAGKVVADVEVVKSLYHRAKGYSHPETKVFCKPGGNDEDDPIITHEVTRHYPPDPTSIIYWLNNRQPELWKGKREEKASSDDLIEALSRLAGALPS